MSRERDEEGQPYFLGSLGMRKKILASFSTLPCLQLILCSCLAAPSLLLLLFKGLPVVLPRPGRPSQNHVSRQLWIATRAPSQGCLSLHRTRLWGLAKSLLEREALLSTPQALFSLKIRALSPLSGLRNV